MAQDVLSRPQPSEIVDVSGAREWPGALRETRPVRAWCAGARFGAAGAIGLWLGDVMALSQTLRASAPATWLTALGAALFVALTTGTFLGMCLGPVCAGAAADVTRSIRAWWHPLRAGDVDVTRAFASHLLAGSVLLVIWGSLAYRLPMALAQAVARPDAMASAMVASHLAFALTFALAWRPTLRLSCRITAAATRPSANTKATAWRVSLRPIRPLYAVACLAAAWLVGALVVCRSHAGDIMALGHLDALRLLCMCAGWIAAADLPRFPLPWGPRLKYAAAALVGLAFVGSAVAAGRISGAAAPVRELAFERALSGRLGYAGFATAFDFDGDGQLSILGGGDCAPFDPRRYTGAPEIAANGIDEDCDGKDRAAAQPGPHRRVRANARDLPSRPTLVLVTIDGLSAERVGASGGRNTLMPNLWALSQRSASFANCFSEGPSTRLSFPSMFTSRYDSELAFDVGPTQPHPLAASERQLQDLLADAGYETVAVIPNSYFERRRWPSVTRGFERVDASALAGGKHNAPQVTDAALRVLSETRERPLYLWVHYFDAHGPYLRVPGVSYASYTDEALHEYELTYIDHELGRLIAALDARAEPNYVIVTADHGTVFRSDPNAQRGHYGFDLHSATLHVPLIVRGPSLKPARVDGVVSTMDIVPTIADLLHVADNPQFDGESLLPVALGLAPSAFERTVFHELNLPERRFRGQDPLKLVSVQDSHWNLTLDRDRGQYELYDWTVDDSERVDVYQEKMASAEIVRLRSLLGGLIGRARAVDAP